MREVKKKNSEKFNNTVVEVVLGIFYKEYCGNGKDLPVSLIVGLKFWLFCALKIK